MISHEHKFIFIHIPKTSGNSLAFALKNHVSNVVEIADNQLGQKQGVRVFAEHAAVEIKHKPLQWYVDTYGERIKDYFKFSIVRNPYDRIMSYYFWFLGAAPFSKQGFQKYCRNSRNFQHAHVCLHSEVACHLVRFENLLEGLKAIEPIRGLIDFERYPVLNKSRNNYRKYYDAEMQRMVYAKWRKDFELLNYSKEI